MEQDTAEARQIHQTKVSQGGAASPAGLGALIEDDGLAAVMQNSVIQMPLDGAGKH